MFLFCCCVRYGRRSDTKAGHKMEILACGKCYIFWKKKKKTKKRVESGHQKKWMLQVPCSSCSQTWRRKEMPEAGDRDLLHSAYTPAHLQEHWQVSSWADRVTVIFVSGWCIRVYKKYQFGEEEKKDFPLVKRFSRILPAISICCLLPGALNQSWTDPEIVSLRQLLHICKFRARFCNRYWH